MLKQPESVDAVFYTLMIINTNPDVTGTHRSCELCQSSHLSTCTHGYRDFLKSNRCQFACDHSIPSNVMHL